MTELGKRLEEARKQKNLTLDELQSVTKIQKRYLKAIEEGNYGVLPGKFYARAFIRQYADAVGLDPERIFDEFAADIPKSDVENPSGLSRTQTKKTPVSNKSSILFAMLPKMLVTILVVSVAVFIWLYMQKLDIANNTDNDSANTVESQTDENITIVNQENEGTEEATNESTNTPEPGKETQQSSDQTLDPEETKPIEVQQLLQVGKQDGKTPYTTYELKGADKFEVELVSTGNSYIGIVNGIGKSFYGEELGNGEKINYDFSGEQEIEFNIGRTLDVQLKINGQPVDYPYPPNERVHQKLKIVYKKEIQ